MKRFVAGQLEPRAATPGGTRRGFVLGTVAESDVSGIIRSLCHVKKRKVHGRSCSHLPLNTAGAVVCFWEELVDEARAAIVIFCTEFALRPTGAEHVYFVASAGQSDIK